MDTIIWRKLSHVPSEIQQVVRETDLVQNQHKFHVQPPSGMVGIYLVVFGFLFLLGAALSGHALFIKQEITLSGLKLSAFVVFMLVGIICIYTGVRMDIKHIFHNRYYLFLSRDYLLERSFRRITYIPRVKLRYSFERQESNARGGEIYFDSLIYLDESGEQLQYDLNDHYFLGKGSLDSREGHDQIYKVIKRYYHLPERKSELAS